MKRNVCPRRQTDNTSRDMLYRDFMPLVNRLVGQYGKTAEQRQDLQGEIYCQFCRHLENYDANRGAPLHPYIVRMLTASVFTYARKQWILEARETEFDEIDSYYLTSMLDPTPQWIHHISQDQILASLPCSILELPERQRKVVMMRFYEQRAFDEIARFLNIKASTARSLLRHGLQSLRKHVSARDSEDSRGELNLGNTGGVVAGNWR